MSDVDFQNGFLCGMATKGLVRSGELYKPIIWNIPGIYTYFYIDFRRPMEAFSTGMFNESIIVNDSVQINVTDVSSKMTENPYIPVPVQVSLNSGSMVNTIIEDGKLVLYFEII